MAGGLLGLIGVVVKGGAEEAGLYLVTLAPHDVGTAGTCPILHGAPGGDHPVPSSVVLSVYVFIHPYFHLCPHPSISGDRDASLSPSIPALISPQLCPHPSLPPCVTPSPAPSLLAQPLHTCCFLDLSEDYLLSACPPAPAEPTQSKAATPVIIIAHWKQGVWATFLFISRVPHFENIFLTSR